MKKLACIAALSILLVLICGPAAAVDQPVDAPIKVAVLPFVNKSLNPDFAYIGPMLVDALEYKIAAAGVFDLVDPALVHEQIRSSSFDPSIFEGQEVIKRTGQNLDAEVMLCGYYERSGGYLNLEVRIYDSQRGNIIIGTNGVSMYKEFFSSCDEIVLSLAQVCNVVLDAGAHSRMKSIPTNNLSAYATFVDALMASRSGRSAAALEFLDKATSVDPGFCRALRLAAKLAVAANDPSAAERSARAAQCTGR
ncbi:MAG: hypothetical protein P9M14_15090 [Candidatus Alcyoniella australis]|nr:hypothetical protein [Candidatus Alcyoniella australis]